MDTYPRYGEFVTDAQAEGAIEGTFEMYEMNSPFETDFAFSRFRSTRAPSRSVNNLNIVFRKDASKTRTFVSSASSNDENNEVAGMRKKEL